MRAMILAAGHGERMQPLTDKIPKSMLDVNDKPLIQYHVENLVQSGIVDIVINHAVFGDQIEDYLGDGKHWDARIVYSPEDDEPLDTAGGIVKALPLLGDESFLTVNADVWTDFPFQQLSGLCRNRSDEERSNRLAHIILVDNPAHNLEGDFSLSGDRVLNEGEPMLTFSGISIFTPEFFEDCSPGSAPLVPMIRHAAAQRRVTGSHYRGEWRDIGTPERLQALRQSFEHK
ncbi:MAG: nucleotidyltransferase family protein [Gammaproteobacteria bacterium]